MKQYAPANIRNVALAGHQESGKTMLAEAMMFTTGAIGRLGKIEDGNTMMDFSPEEVERQISIQASVAFVEGLETKVNLVDTPGYEDFVGDVLQGIGATENTLIAVRADGGVEVGTEKVFGYTEELGRSAMFVITKMGKEHADFEGTVAGIQETFGGQARVVFLPIGQGDSFKGVVDLFHNKAFEFDGGKRTEIDIPADMQERAAALRKDLMESAAETDEGLMEKYLDEGSLSEDEFKLGLVESIHERGTFPIMCCDALSGVGVTALLNAVVDLLPAADHGSRAVDGDEDTKVNSEGAGAAAYVFKSVNDSHVGDMLLMRVYSGTFSSGSEAYNSSRDQVERLGQLYAVRGKERVEVDKLGPGDIGAVVKLKSTKIRDTLTDKGGPKLAKTLVPYPRVFSAIYSANTGDEDKVGAGLHKIMDEDPAFTVKIDEDTKETLITGQGELHLDVIVGKLKSRFGVDVKLEKPKIAYRETITRKAEAQGKYKKQTGGRGQYGDVHLRLEPMPRGSNFEFVDAIVGGVVPGKFIPAVEKGVIETMSNGVVAKCRMEDVKVTLFDGSYHNVDSSENSFKMAASMAFKKAVEAAGPILLEPIINVQVKVPEDYVGDVMGDLSSRRGKVQGMEPQGKYNIINAQVPLAELYRYSTTLRSMSQGRGTHRREFSHYEEVPHDVAQKVIEATKAGDSGD